MTQQATRPSVGAFRSSVLLSTLSLGTSALGVLSQMVQARQFGATTEMGAYFAAFSVTGVVLGMTSNVLPSVILPILAGLKGFGSEQRRAVTSLFQAVLIASLFLSTAGILSTPVIIRLVMPQASDVIFHLACQVSRLLWLAVGISIIANFLGSLHQFRANFLRTGAMALLLPALVIISTLLGSRTFGVLTIAVGLLLGAIFQVTLLLPGTFKLFARPSIQDLTGPVSIAFWRTIPAVMVSLVPFTAAPFIAVFWAERTNPSAVPFFGYCGSVATVLSVAVSYGLSTASFPDLARIAASGQHAKFLHDTRRYLKYVFMASVLLAAVIGACREPFLTMLLRRGAFDNRAVHSTAALLPWYLIGAVCIACLNFLRNVYYAKGERWQLALSGLITPLLFYLTASLLRYPFGIHGLAMAYALSCIVHVVMVTALLRVPGGCLWSHRLGYEMVTYAVIAIFTVVVSEVVTTHITPVSFWLKLAVLMPCITVTLVLLFVFILSPEEKYFIFCRKSLTRS